MRAALGLALWAVLAVLSGCGGEQASGPAGGLRIAVVPKGTTHEFWKSVHAGAQAAAAELGVAVEWKGPFRENDRLGQVEVIEGFVGGRVDGIVLAPLDETALVAPVRAAHAEGIPVVVIDSALGDGPQISFVATDNTVGGALAARHLGGLLEGRGKVLVLRYQEGSASTDKRERGFLETMAREFPGIEIVADNQYGGATIEEACKASENLLVRFRELDGVFTPNESTTLGMLRALQDDGRAGAVRFVGFDSSSRLLGAMRKGEVHGLVLQDPFRMGRVGVETMAAHLRGEKVSARIDTGVHLATPDNLDSQEIQDLLAPDLRGK